MAADPKWPREQPAEIELLGKSGIMRRPVRGAYHYIHDVGGRVVASSEMEDEHVRDIGKHVRIHWFLGETDGRPNPYGPHRRSSRRLISGRRSQ
jgi:hypothetical protein